MRIIIAPDSFKECLTATEVAQCISRGVRKVAPTADIRMIPIADGGEGTVESLVLATGGSTFTVPVVDPLMRPITAKVGILGDGETAVIEMAAASGLSLVEPQKRNPLKTSSYGTGLLIKTVMERGYKKVILGIGGSATNDGGAGMAQALGIKLLNDGGNEIGPGGENLHNLARIDISKAHSMLSGTEIIVACDVINPLCGAQGASVVYGPQKGADMQMVQLLDDGLRHFANVIKKDLNLDVADVPGAGAAGGLGAGLLAFTNAKLKPGFDILSEIIGLEEAIATCDLVFTAEGKIDFQTQFGKTPCGVGRLALKHKKPAVALAGTVEAGTDELHVLGITAIFSISDGPTTLEESIKNAAELLERKTEQVIRLFLSKSSVSS